MTITLLLGSRWLDEEFCAIEEDFGMRRHWKENKPVEPVTDEAAWSGMAADMPTREALRAVFKRRVGTRVDTITLPNVEAAKALRYWLVELSIRESGEMRNESPEDRAVWLRYNRGCGSIDRQLAKQGVVA